MSFDFGKKISNSNRMLPAVLAVLIAISLGFISCQNAHAQVETQSDQLRVLFIIDDSGSMATSDPTDLRYTAVKLFASALDEGDAVGVIRFSSQSTLVTNGWVEITNADRKQTLLDTIQPVPADGYTDFQSAFKLAQSLLDQDTSGGNKTVLVLLTDGKPEIQNSYVDYENETLTLASQLNVPVYSIALTAQGQTGFLSKVSAQTNGELISAKSANDLLDSYLRILGDLKDRTITGEGVTNSPSIVTISLPPALIPYIDKVTFIASKSPSTQIGLISPDGETIQPDAPIVDFASTNDPGFSVYSLKKPASGDWTIAVGGSGQAQVRAILHSRLRVMIKSPVSLVEAGIPMSVVVNLVEEQSDGATIKIVGDASFSAAITLPDGSRQSLDNFYDDGTHGDKVAGDGDFSRDFVDTFMAGTYQIAVQGFKGVVPVATSARIEAVAFPTVIIEQPQNQVYEVRDDAVPFNIHLQNGFDEKEFEGTIVAVVSSPSGKTTEIELKRNGLNFLGDYLPEESGNYSVVFRPMDAYYLGLPYSFESDANFEAQIIPKLQIEKVQLGLDSSDNQDVFEVAQAVAGIPVVVTIQSNSPNPEYITAGIENMPGFSLQETNPIEIPAGTTSDVTLHIKGDAQIKAGAWNGKVVFKPEGTIDIVGINPELNLSLFNPMVDVRIRSVSVENEPGKCWQTNGVTIMLETNSTSLVPEKVDVRLAGIPNSVLSPTTLTIQPGNGQMQLQIKPEKSFAVGTYTGSIVVENVRPGVQISDNSNFLVQFEITPAWKNCQKPMIFLGVGGLLLIILFVMGTIKAKNSSKPPIIRGTLTHWDKENPDLTTSVDLTAMKKTEIRIGKASSNDVVIPDATVDDFHAVLIAEKMEDEIRYTLLPKSRVKRGYREYSDVISLDENVTYQMGNHCFSFIRDIEL
jgi:hypothetical protein